MKRTLGWKFCLAFLYFFTWSTKIQQQIANGFISNRSDFARARNSNLSTFDGVVL